MTKTTISKTGKVAMITSRAATSFTSLARLSRIVFLDRGGMEDHYQVVVTSSDGQGVSYGSDRYH